MAEQKQPTQVVLVMTDSQGVNVLNCYNQVGLQTPRLDRLASEGILFDRAYTTSPVCSPARGAIFTGMYPHANGCWGNSMPLGQNIRTIGQRLRDHGIAAGYIGKWHLDAFDYFGTGECPDGWDPGHWYDHRMFLEELSPDERRRSRDWNSDPNFPTRMEDTFAHRCADRASEFLRGHVDQPFLLVVSFDEPHGPHKCPPEFEQRYADYTYPHRPNMDETFAGKPAQQEAWSRSLGLRNGHKPVKSPGYFGCNEFVDHEIGRVLDAVDQFAPGAMVLFTSDHGYLLHAHRLYGKGPCMYDEASRIPLLMRWPGHIEPGRVVRTPVSHIDLTPTILEAFGLPCPPVIQGESLLPLINADGPHERTIFIEFNRFGAAGTTMGGLIPIRAAFDGRHKLAINLFDTDELYDIQTDPHELVNLIDSSDHAQIRATLHDRILDWMAQTTDPFACWQWSERPWRSRRPEDWWQGDKRPVPKLPQNDGYSPRSIDYTTGQLE